MKDDDPHVPVRKYMPKKFAKKKYSEEEIKRILKPMKKRDAHKIEELIGLHQHLGFCNPKILDQIAKWPHSFEDLPHQELWHLTGISDIVRQLMNLPKIVVTESDYFYEVYRIVDYLEPPHTMRVNMPDLSNKNKTLWGGDVMIPLPDRPKGSDVVTHANIQNNLWALNHLELLLRLDFFDYVTNLNGNGIINFRFDIVDRMDFGLMLELSGQAVKVEKIEE